MLMTPIKPKIFPHSVMPFTRPKSAADIMTRSLLIPSYDATVSTVLGKQFLLLSLFVVKIMEWVHLLLIHDVVADGVGWNDFFVWFMLEV